MSIVHMLFWYVVLHEIRDEYYTDDSFKTIPEIHIVEYLWETGSCFFLHQRWNTVSNPQFRPVPTWCNFELESVPNYLTTQSEL